MNEQPTKSIKELIRNLLEEGKVERALRVLKNQYPNDNKITHLLGQYSRYKTEKILTLVSGEDSEKTINRITFNLTELLDTLEEPTQSRFIDIEEIKNEQVVFNSKSWIEYGTNKSLLIVFVIVAFISAIFSVAVLCFNLFGLSNLTKNNGWVYTFRDFSFLAHLFIGFISLYKIPKINVLKDLSKYLFFNKEYESDDFKKNVINANEVIKDFKTCWQFTWLGWVLLYIFYIIKDWYIQPNIRLENNLLHFFIFAKEVVNILMNVFRNFSTLGIIGCFSILYFKKKNENSNHYNNIVTGISFVLLLILLIFEIIFVLLHPNTIDTAIDKSEIFIQLLTKICFAISLCLLTGRLNGRLFDSDFAIIFSIIFYAYAAIQIAFPLVNETSDIYLFFKAFTLNFSTFSQCILFIYILWLIESGKMMTYAIRINSIMKAFDENIK